MFNSLWGPNWRGATDDAPSWAAEPGFLENASVTLACLGHLGAMFGGFRRKNAVIGPPNSDFWRMARAIRHFQASWEPCWGDAPGKKQLSGRRTLRQENISVTDCMPAP